MDGDRKTWVGCASANTLEVEGNGLIHPMLKLCILEELDILRLKLEKTKKFIESQKIERISVSTQISIYQDVPNKGLKMFEKIC